MNLKIFSVVIISLSSWFSRQFKSGFIHPYGQVEVVNCALHIANKLSVNACPDACLLVLVQRLRRSPPRKVNYRRSKQQNSSLPHLPHYIANALIKYINSSITVAILLEANSALFRTAVKTLYTKGTFTGSVRWKVWCIIHLQKYKAHRLKTEKLNMGWHEVDSVNQ